MTSALTPKLEPIRWERLNPPLKWAGGKRWILPDLEPLWKTHSHRRLVEPFAAGWLWRSAWSLSRPY
ncbi:MAG TPA: hypothetical protein VNO70_11345, partial [Blastocatellia bacterium]|nr:hypothetical protein [Blastocatellia bacterium]